MNTVISDEMQSMTAQNTRHLLQNQVFHREQVRQVTAAQLEVQRLEKDRTIRNQLRRQITDVVSDAMTILKKNGDEIRQSAKG